MILTGNSSASFLKILITNGFVQSRSFFNSKRTKIQGFRIRIFSTGYFDLRIPKQCYTNIIEKGTWLN